MRGRLLDKASLLQYITLLRRVYFSSYFDLEYTAETKYDAS